MNAVLTCLGNLSPIVLDRFAKSFRSANIVDNIVVFVNNRNIQQHKERFKQLRDEYRLIIVQYSDNYCLHPAELMTKRFYLYEMFLNEYPKYDRVFVCDTRDLIFQRNIFDYTSTAEMIFFAEADKIVNEPINYGMLKTFVPEIQESVKNNNILCMGTLMGTQQGFLQFVQQFKGIMENNAIPKNFDQCVLNIMVYHHKLFGIPFEIKQNKDGWVNTVGLKQSYREINQDGFFVDENRNISAVVHQFDRCPKKDIAKIGEIRHITMEDLLL